MLAIRLQRRGRKGSAQYRVIVQDAKLNPKSGRVVAALGSYDPHTKAVTIDKEKAELYLKNGAQPSPRVVSLLEAQKVSLPKWVETRAKQEKAIRNPDKLRRNRPAEEAAPEEAPAEEPAAEASTTETPEEVIDANADDEAVAEESEPTEETAA